MDNGEKIGNCKNPSEQTTAGEQPATVAANSAIASPIDIVVAAAAAAEDQRQVELRTAQQEAATLREELRTARNRITNQDAELMSERQQVGVLSSTCR